MTQAEQPGVDAKGGSASLRRRQRRPTPRETALLRVVERFVLPDLVLRRRGLVPNAPPGLNLEAEVPGMTRQALEGDDRAARSRLRRLKGEGASFADLQLGLLAPAANELDFLWRTDRVSFMDVTFAIGSLQRSMRFVALDLFVPPPPRARALRIAIASAPGEVHRFGPAMVAEFFRQDGWQVHYDPGMGPDDLLDLVQNERIDVVGLSASTEPIARGLADLIPRLRLASCNPRLLVIVGGGAISRNPALIAEIGADAAIAALETGPATAGRMVDARTGRGNGAAKG